MKWTIRGKNHQEWRRWFAWHPVSWFSHRADHYADTHYVWLQWVERRPGYEGYDYRQDGTELGEPDENMQDVSGDGTGARGTSDRRHREHSLFECEL